MKSKYFKIFSIYFLITTLYSCTSDVEETELEVPKFSLEEYSKPKYFAGIPIYTVDMKKNRVSDVNSEWVIRNSSVVTTSQIIHNKYNAAHKINYESLRNPDDYFEFVIALHGNLVNKSPIPKEFTENLTGIRFRAVSLDNPLTITVEAYNSNDVLLKSQNFELTVNVFSSYEMSISDKSIHYISFKILGKNQKSASFSRGSIALDDIYINTLSNTVFTPPTNDTQLINWINESSLRYFIWNYRDVNSNQGIVLEASDNPSRVSLSGLGYSYANFILAANKGLISEDEAKNKILSLLNWQNNQNWFNGFQGKFGFPFHYYNSDGNGLYRESPEAVSTIDWAICAAGIRVVKEKYKSNAQIVNICNELLSRPDWVATVYNQTSGSYRRGRITKGLSGISGDKNGQVWGDAFTEEAELVYLEAMASGKVNNLDVSRIYRKSKNGIYVSWFGSGFTYNWLQLWTGLKEPYATNSNNAYQIDHNASISSFGIPIMGLTACSTISNIDSSGFVEWNWYLGNQGSTTSGANQNEIVRLSPAVYGAVLALPFNQSIATTSIKEFLNIGYYHPLLGLPDNVRLKNLPTNLNVPIPNWSTFDINVGPIALAIDMYQQKIISTLYMQDTSIQTSLNKLIQSF